VIRQTIAQRLEHNKSGPVRFVTADSADDCPIIVRGDALLEVLAAIEGRMGVEEESSRCGEARSIRASG
jgi:hypothetical protein